MRNFLIGLAGAAAVLTAVPAAARPWAPRPALRSEIRQDINQLNMQISRAEARHTISRREAAQLRRQAAQTRAIYAGDVRDGLTRGELAALEQRINTIRSELRLARRNWGV